MKYHFAFFLCLFSFSVIAQTSYQDFIQQDSSIQWAAECNVVMNITPRVKKFGIKEILFQQQAKNSCIDTYRIEGDSIIKSRFCKDDNLAIDSFISSENVYKEYVWNAGRYDENPFILTEKKCSCNKREVGNKIDVYKLKQLIYYKNSILYTKNVLVTPLCLKGTIDINNERNFVWQSSFSSCLNNANNTLTIEQKRKSVDLGNSEQVYNLNYDNQIDSTPANIFILKNPSLSHHLFEDIFANKVTVVDDSNNIIPAKKVFEYKHEPVQVTEYDANGNVKGYKMVVRELNLDNLYKFKINQHFYFDTSNNILYSEVNFIELLMNVVTSQGVSLGETTYFKVYFIKPSLFKKPIVHRFLND